MLLKIVYGDSKYKYFLDVREIEFASSVSDDALCEPIEGNCYDGESNVWYYIDANFLKKEVGCSKHPTLLDKHYFNTAHIVNKDRESFVVGFTGTAYLCDDSGKTVDTLR